MDSYKKLLADNKAWAKDKIKNDADFFKRLSAVQKPEYLWIGCSDSRVPANQITGTTPGEMFVHRNIANLVIHTDVNLVSVLEFAVAELKVQHIIVCGHYGCGGIRAAMDNKDHMQVLNIWLRNIKDVYHTHRKELEQIENLEQRANRLTEINVIEQVQKLAKTSTVQRAWKERNSPYLHGWVYSLDNGIINPIYEMNPHSVIDPLYKFEF